MSFLKTLTSRWNKAETPAALDATPAVPGGGVSLNAFEQKKREMFALVLLLIGAIVAIAAWVASSNTVDATQGNKVKSGTTFSTLVQQAQSIENGFSQLLATADNPSAVKLTDIFSTTMTKALTVPADATVSSLTPYASAISGMTSGGWSLITVRAAPENVDYRAAAAGPVPSAVCDGRMAGIFSGVGSNSALASAFAASPTTLSISFAGNGYGCVKTTEGQYVFVYRIGRAG